MAKKKPERSGPSDEGFDDFVPAVFARSTDEAERFRELLDDHDIPAVVITDQELGDRKDQNHRADQRTGLTQGVAVLVPEVLLDEASQIIADYEDSDEYRAGDEDLEEGEEEEEEDEFDVKEELVEDDLSSPQAEDEEEIEELDEDDDFDPEDL